MKLAEIARRVGGVVSGDAAVEITGVAPIETAGPGEITVLSRQRYMKWVPRARASAIITGEEFAKSIKWRTLVIAKNPYEAFSVVLHLFTPEERIPKGVSNRAHIAPTARIEDGAAIMAGAFIDAETFIGRNTIVYPNAFIGYRAKVGAECRIYASVTIRERCQIGDRCIIHPGAVIGADGFGFNSDAQGHHKVPQIGRVVIEEDVEIGANCTIDRGTVGDTVIGRGVKLDNLIQVGHNVRIGEFTVIAAQTGISGSTKIGEWAQIGGQAGFAGHIIVGNRVKVVGQSGVIGDVGDDETIAGYPAVDRMRWLRNTASLERVGDFMREQRASERDRGRKLPDNRQAPAKPEKKP
ncbi:MAG: UDP-3-O-(3-hydroxymyristoyl)glucosamine N-acyltransferase [Deltaproteobacteria bacterium]|nr:UDP-3-O-(3-hydroxymyristoyl)glucosamine N-acyltransferase [Deltaproteobacteria bacterium]